MLDITLAWLASAASGFAMPPAQQPAAAEQSAESEARERALAKTRQMLEQRPTHAALFDRYFKLLVQGNRVGEEIDALEARRKKDPKEFGIATVLGRLLLRANREDDALEVLATIDDSRPELQSVLGDIYEKLKQYDRAQRAFRAALPSAKTTEAKRLLYEKMGKAHLALGDRDKALDAWAEIGKLDGGRFHRRLHVAELLVEAGLVEEAKQAYAPLLEETASEPERHCRVLRDFGRLQELEGQLEAALETYDSAIELTARGNWLRKELEKRTVHIFRRTGRLEELVAELERKRAADPSDLPTVELLADVWTEMRELDKASAALASARERFPKDRRLARRLADLYLQQKQVDQAIATFQSILSEHPNEIDLYLELGALFAQSERLTEAKHQWEKVVEREIADATLCARIAAMYSLWDLVDDAVRLYERAIELESEDIVRYTDLASYLFRVRRRDEGLEVLARARTVATGKPRRLEGLATEYREYGLTEEAKSCFEEILTLEPANQEVRYGLAQLLVDERSYEAAQALLWQIVDGEDNSAAQGFGTMAATMLVNLAVRLQQLERLQTEAEKRTSPGALLVLGRLHSHNRDFEAAIVSYRAAIERQPDNIEAHRLLARMLTDMSDFDGALAIYEHIAVLSPGERRRNFREIARLHLERHDVDGAIAEWQDALKRNPDDASVFLDVGREYLQIQRIQEAVDCFDHAAQLKPENADVRLRLAASLRRAGKYEESEAEYRALATTATDPADREFARAQLFEIYAEQGRIDEEIERLESIVEDSRYDVDAPQLLADMYLRTGDYVLGLELLEQTLRYQPRNQALLIRRAELLEALEDWTEARVVHEELLKFPDADRDRHLAGIGKALFEVGLAEQAKATFAKINDRSRASQLYDRYELHAEAVEYFKKAVARNPRDRRSYSTLARQLEKAGRDDEAIEVLERLLDIAPYYRTALNQLGQLYARAGRRDDAVAIGKRLFGLRGERTEDEKNARESAQQNPNYYPRYYGGFYGYYNGPSQRNLAAAQQYFRERGLTKEWADVLLAEAERRPTNQALYQAVRSLYSWEQKSAAKQAEYLQKLRRLDLDEHRMPPSMTRRSFREMIERDLIGLWQQDAKVAETRLAAIDAATESVEAQIERAALLGALGKRDEREQALRTALTLAPDHPVALAALAGHLRTDKQLDEAIETYQRLLDWWDSDAAESTLAELDRRQALNLRATRRSLMQNLPRRVRRQLRDEDLRAMHARTLVWPTGGGYGGYYYPAGASLATISFPEALPSPPQILQDLMRLHSAKDDAAGLATVTERALAFADNLARRATVGAVLVEVKRFAEARPLLQAVIDEGRTLREDELQTYFWQNYQGYMTQAANGLGKIFEANGEFAEAYEILSEFGAREEALRVVQEHDISETVERQLRSTVEHQAGRLREARASAARDIRTVELDYRDAVIRLANFQLERKDFDGAERGYVESLELLPDDLEILGTVANLRQRRNAKDETIATHEEIIAAKRRKRRAGGTQVMAPPTRLRPSMPQSNSGTIFFSGGIMQRGNTYWRSSYFNYSVDENFQAILTLLSQHNDRDGVAETLNRMTREEPATFRRIARTVVNMLQDLDLGARKLHILRLLRTAVKGNEWLTFSYGEACADIGEDKEAIRAFEELANRGTAGSYYTDRAVRELARLRKKKNSGANALVELRAKVDAEPDNVRHRLALAEFLHTDRKHREALAELEIIVEKAPYLARAKELTIAVGSALGDDEVVEAMLRRLLDEAKESTQKIQRGANLADWLYASGRVEAACEIIESLEVEANTNYNAFSPGNWLLDRHMLERAIERYEREIERQSNYGYYQQQIRPRLARIEMATGREVAAIGRYLEAIDEAGSLADRELRFRDLLQVMLNHPDPDRLHARLEPEHGKRETTADRLVMACAEFARGDFAAGERELENAVTQSSKEVYLFPLLLGLKRQRHDFEAALAVIDQMGRVYGGSDAQQWSGGVRMTQRERLQIERAIILRQMGREDEALELIETTIDLTQPHAYASLAHVYRGLELHDLALTTFRKHREKTGSKTAGDDLTEAEMLLSLDRVDEAIEVATHAAKISANSQQTSQLLVKLHRKRGTLEQYAAELAKDYEKDKQDQSLRQLLLELYGELGRTDAIDRIREDMLADVTTRQRTLQELAREMESAGDTEEAISYYQRLLELQGGQSKKSTHNRLARLYLTLGDVDAAEPHYREYLDLESPSGLASLAGWLRNNRDDDDALPVWQQVFERDPKNPSALDALAARAFDDGEYRKCLEMLTDAMVLTYTDSTGGRRREMLLDAFAELPEEQQTELSSGEDSHSLERRLILLAGRGRADEARGIAERLLQIPDHNSVLAADLLYRLAKDGDDRRAHIEAAERLRQAQERRSPNPTTMRNLRDEQGRIHLLLGDVDAAVAAWRAPPARTARAEVSTTYRSDYNVRYTAANFTKMGRPDLALRALEQEFLQRERPPWAELFDAMAKGGQAEAAARLLRRQIDNPMRKYFEQNRFAFNSIALSTDLSSAVRGLVTLHREQGTLDEVDSVIAEIEARPDGEKLAQALRKQLATALKDYPVLAEIAQRELDQRIEAGDRLRVYDYERVVVAWITAKDWEKAWAATGEILDLEQQNLSDWHPRFRDSQTRWTQQYDSGMIDPNNPFSFTFQNTGGGGWASGSSSGASNTYLHRAQRRAAAILHALGQRERALAVERFYLTDCKPRDRITRIRSLIRDYRTYERHAEIVRVIDARLNDPEVEDVERNNLATYLATALGELGDDARLREVRLDSKATIEAQIAEHPRRIHLSKRARLVTLLKQLGEPAQALAELEKLEQLALTRASYARQKAEILVDLGRHAEAEPLFGLLREQERRNGRIDNGDPALAAHHGLCLAALGRLEEAKPKLEYARTTLADTSELRPKVEAALAK